MTLSMSLKRPSAFLPLAMSAAALVLVLGQVAVVGVAGARQPDEGGVAHIFLLLIVAQVPIASFFAIKWLPRAAGISLGVLALQAAAVIAALTPVYLFNL